MIDAYQAYVLMKLSPLSPNIPQFGWEAVRVKFAHHQVKRLKAAGLMDLAREMSRHGKLTTDELAEAPGRFLMCTRGSYGVTKLFGVIGPERVELVWSMWRGYWERSGGMRDWAEREGVAVRFVHSGGHAWPEDLRRLVGAVGAKQTVWVHTDSEQPGVPA